MMLFGSTYRLGISMQILNQLIYHVVSCTLHNEPRLVQRPFPLHNYLREYICWCCWQMPRAKYEEGLHTCNDHLPCLYLINLDGRQVI